MNNYDYLIIFGSVALSVLIGFGIGFNYSSIYTKAEALQEIPDCFCSCPECPSFECPQVPSCYEPVFLQMAENVANELPYDREKWNCLDKSRELVRRLKEAGYDAEIKTGMTSFGLHAWVEIKNIEIESTEGIVIEPPSYKKDYNVVK